MPRLVKRFRQEPFEVRVGTESQWICGCGLSDNLPFCDGTHKTTQDEDPKKLCWYDEDGERHETPDAFRGIRSDRS
jgi:CDGSH-type Zn-finger protein